MIVDKDKVGEAIPSDGSNPYVSSIREKVLVGIKLHKDGIKLREFAVELGVTWQKLLPILKGLVKEEYLQLQDSYYYPKGVEIISHEEKDSDDNLRAKFLSYIASSKNGITLRDAGDDMELHWQRLLPIAKELIAKNGIVKNGNRYFTRDNYSSWEKDEASKTGSGSKVPKPSGPIRETFASREEAKVVDTTSAPSAERTDRKKHRVGTIEGVALILSVLAFGCFWGWTLPSINMVGQDQIAISESMHQVYTDIAEVKSMLEQAKTEMDVRKLREIQIILDDLVTRRHGAVNYQAFKIKQDIDQLIKMLSPGALVTE